jgi:hypothetical protein
MTSISSETINTIISTPAVVPAKALSVLQKEYALWINFVEYGTSFVKNRCTDSPYCTGLVDDQYCCNCEGEYLDELERKEAARYAAVHIILDERESKKSYSIKSKGKKSKGRK